MKKTFLFSSIAAISAVIGNGAMAAAPIDISEDSNGIITISDGNSYTTYNKDAVDTAINTAVGALQTQAETIFAEKQTWVDNTLGITSANPNAVNNEYASTNYLTGATTLTGADIALDNAISTKQDAITDSNKLSAGLVDGLATVATSGNASDLNNDAGFITKDVDNLTNYTTTTGMNAAINTAVGALQTQAETIFAEKQTWVDNTLGITSANPNAVNNEYASTNYLTSATTLTGADIALDNAISTKQDAITDSNKLSAGLVDGLAAVATSGNASDLNNDAGFITKDVDNLTNYTTTTGMNAAINTTVGALQTQVDNTLGITSANPNAVNDEYASTNYLTGATTLTGADIALDNAIKTNADAIATNNTDIANLQNNKANLHGGNTFSGNQTINNGNLAINNGNLVVGGTLRSTGTATVGSLVSNGAITGTTGTFTNGMSVTGNSSVSGNQTVGGTLTVTDHTYLSDLSVSGNETIGGALNVTHNATVGSLTSNGAISGTTGTYSGLLSSNGLNAGSGNISTTGNISGAAGTFSGALTSNGLDAGSGNISTTGNISGATGTFSGALTSNGLDAGSGAIMTSGMLMGSNLAVANNAMIGGQLTAGATHVSSLSFGGTDSVNAIDTGENALTAGNTSTIATTATVFNEIGDRAALSDTNGNLTAGQTIVAGLNALDSAIGNRNFARLNTTNGTLTDAVNSLDTEIGADADYETTFNGVSATNSVKANINALNETVGDISALAEFVANASTGNAVTNGGDNVPTTIVGAINNIDATLGTIHHLNAKRGTDAKGNLATGTTVEQHLVALDDAIGNRTNYTNQYNITNGQAVAASLDALDSTIGNVSNVTNTNHNITGETIAAKLETVDTNMGDLAALTHNAFGGATTDITTAMNTLAENVENATGGTFAANGSWSGNVDNTGVVDYTYGTSANSVMGAVNQVASNVGTTATASKGNILAANTVNQNLDMIDAAIGNRATIHSANATINDAVRNQDLTHAIETTGNLIGNMDFDGTRYVAHMTNLTDAVRTLDNNVGRIENKLEKVEYNLKSGLAAMSALSALVPNARDCGDTQLSVGTGVYADRVGVAFGGFHYINDHVLFNAGASYGGTRDWAFRAGVTFGL